MKEKNGKRKEAKNKEAVEESPTKKKKMMSFH